MDELNELKELMDIAEAKAIGCEHAWRKANEEFAKAKQAYEKERDKDKKCESCMYNIVLDFSEDGWHNLCGNPNAPCTCCNSKCEYYKPDNVTTKAVKDYYNNKDKFRGPNLDKEVIKGLKLLGYDVFYEYTPDDYAQRKAKEVVEILKILESYRYDD